MFNRIPIYAGAALALALGAHGAKAQDSPPIKVGMTVSSTGTFALAAQS
jgi:hypothetical protein